MIYKRFCTSLLSCGCIAEINQQGSNSTGHEQVSEGYIFVK